MLPPALKLHLALPRAITRLLLVQLFFNCTQIHAITYTKISAISGAINGFGLLQAVEHFNLTGTTMTLTFLHFLIQEYLTAYYVTSQQDDKEFRVDYQGEILVHFNMFSIIHNTHKETATFFQIIFVLETEQSTFLIDSLMITYYIFAYIDIFMKLGILRFAKQ